MLAAPGFAAAALGRRREVIFPIGCRMLLFPEITVNSRSTAPGTLISKLEESGASRIRAWASAGEDWNWGSEDHRLEADDRLAVVATRAGLAGCYG
ncbi:MAG TPA: hypothetical protein VLJ88_15780 [Propionibacteriaceae bacterium]|nr:hypothetical protein [Propionibacteriaceae bacterium]